MLSQGKRLVHIATRVWNDEYDNRDLWREDLILYSRSQNQPTLKRASKDSQIQK
jgi:hypothetical protein